MLYKQISYKLVGNMTIWIILSFIWSCYISTAGKEVNYKRVCYLASWAFKRRNPEGRIDIGDIDPFLCTHIIYAFAKIDLAEMTLKGSQWDDESKKGIVGVYEKVNDLKYENPKLKILLSIGGANEGSRPFDEISVDEQVRVAFADNAVNFLRLWDFDGLDIDWEFPDSKVKHTALIKDFRKAFDREASVTGNRRLLLTVAVGVSEKQITDYYDGRAIARLVDFLNVMTYDFHGPWDQFTGGNSPLISRHQDRRFNFRNSLNWAITRWVQAGLPRRKLMLGISALGRSFTLKNSSLTGVGAPSTGAGKPRQLTQAAGTLAYFEVCQFLDEKANKAWDKTQKFPYAFLKDQWVTYDNIRSITMKIHWAIKQRLGGVMVWSLDLDDFAGVYCNQGPFPLLNSIRDALQGKRYRQLASSSTQLAFNCIIITAVLHLLFAIILGTI